MWDQPQRVNSFFMRSRIIPTYVGSTARYRDSILKSANHSHVCGINWNSNFRMFKPSESFPRMWDQHVPFTDDEIDIRIIPTYVGSTRHILDYEFLAANHSHVCGINGENTSFSRVPHESFPRMWDQLHPGRLSDGRGRIIPTYVGSTCTLVGCRMAAANHSHVCGIN